MPLTATQTGSIYPFPFDIPMAEGVSEPL